MWICPSCRQPMNHQLGSWRCSNGHSFDVAKEGYVNLQLPQERKSRQPGDSKEMVVARREFLTAGHYSPLVDSIAANMNRYLDGDKLTIFDAGCGEGYYLNSIAQQLSNQRTYRTLGCDISKAAIQKAAKRYSKEEFAVASTFNIPLAQDSCHAVVQVFAPSSTDEISRILRSNGLWITVNPGKDHLAELKQYVYDQQTSHSIRPQSSDNFTSIARQQVTFDFELSSPMQRLNLLKMTPFYWHASEQSKADFAAHCRSCTADFDLHVMQKVSSDDAI